MQIHRPLAVSVTALAIAGGSLLLGASASQAVTPTTVSSSTTTTQYTVSGPILEKWNQLGGEYGLIGSPTSSQISVNGGYAQNFQAGSIYFHPSIGVPYVVTGAVEFEYKNKGAASGPLFFPTADAIRTPLRGITVQRFQNGVITFDSNIPQSYSNMPRAVIGEFGFKFNASGGADVLGPATTADTFITGGHSQDFRNGTTMIASSSTGARLLSNAVITNKWKATGSQVGTLKFPTSDPMRSPNGVTYQNFQSGVVLVGENGTTAYAITGGTLNAFNTAGGVNVVGTAKGEAVASGSGTVQTFQNGVIAVSSAGAYFVKNGPVLFEWQKFSQQNGPLGYPASNLNYGPNGATFQKFVRGVITSGQFGTYPIYGPIGDKYTQLGGTPVLGGAKGYEQPRFNGTIQSFEGGTIASSGYTGQHLISNPSILNVWNSGIGDQLRLPVAASYTAYDGSVVQKFEGGVVIVQPNGAVSFMWGSDAQGPMPA